MSQSERHDDDLRAVFAEARRQAQWVPPFDRVLAGRKPRRPARRGRWLAAVVVGAAVVTFVAIRTQPAAPPDWLVMAPGQLESPTDFLLEVRGTEFLRTVPRIGNSERLISLEQALEGQRL